MQQVQDAVTAGVVTTADTNERVDRVGAACSTACAVHCATTAAAPGLLGAMGLGALLSPTLEWGLTGIAVLMALAALVFGWRRHQVPWVLWVLAAGIVGLVAGRMLEVFGVEGFGAPVAVSSGLLLAAGHLAGVRLQRRGRIG